MKREYALKTLKYAALPDLGNRIRGLGLDFAYFAFLMAQIYAAVRLLPPNHPYLQSQSFGKFGVRDVMVVAFRHIGKGLKNIDQMFVFAALVVAVLLLVLQFASALFFLAIHTAEASPLSFTGLFNTDPPDEDLAFILMDHTFGVPEVFQSNVAPASAAARTPFHAALHFLFSYYSMAMLIVAGFILIYYFIVVVLESAQTGTPFGQRFEHMYVPFRLVLCVGMLVPAYYGLNMGQYGTLYVAKWGSGLATNAWKVFNVKLRNPLGLEDEDLVAKPEKPRVNALAEFFFMAHACQAFYENEKNIDIDAYLVKNDDRQVWGSYAAARTFYGNGDIRVVFGEYSEDNYESVKGHVFPYCGALTISTANAEVPIIEALYENGWWTLLQNAWSDSALIAFGERVNVIMMREEIDPENPLGDDPCAVSVPATYPWGSSCQEFPATSFSQEFTNAMQGQFDAIFNTVFDELALGANNVFEMDDTMLNYGWVGAGIWFNKIAELNGAFISTAYLLPEASDAPFVMEFVSTAKRNAEANIANVDMYMPNLPNGKAIALPLKKEDKLALILNATHNYFIRGKKVQSERKSSHGNILIDAMNMVFGETGLLDMRYGNNHGIHPFAQFVGLGKTLIENAIRHLATSSSVALVGGFFSVSEPQIGQGIIGISGMFTAFAKVGFMIGFVLFYIIPFLPFLYFFFSAGRWVRAVFEAMVAVPLWALAHLRIDGNGLPGNAAGNGYVLLLEIFVRPILTLFGFIAAISTFYAMAVVLNEIFDLVVLNLTGHTPDTSGATVTIRDPEFFRGPVDEFFFTLTYVIVLYLMALSSFKLVDGVPNNIMRWMGSGVSTFASLVNDPAENLTSHAAIGSRMASERLIGASQQGIIGVGQGAAAAGDALTEGGLSKSIQGGVQSIATRLYGGGSEKS